MSNPLPLRTLISGGLLACGHIGALIAILSGHIAWGALTLLTTHIFYLLGTLIPNSPIFGPVVRSFTSTRPEVWLTIDDGVDPKTTPALLDYLREINVHVTFFIIGDRAHRYPKLTARIEAEGHTIGGHSRTHPQASFWAAFPRRIRRELNDKAFYFRAPVGMANWFVHVALRKRGRPLVGWSARGIDGVPNPRTTIIETLSRGICPGAILMIHDGYNPKARGYAPVDILRDLLNQIEAQGYRCILPHPNTLSPHLPPDLGKEGGYRANDRPDALA